MSEGRDKGGDTSGNDKTEKGLMERWELGSGSHFDDVVVGQLLGK
jgi:hypothetical protein